MPKIKIVIADDNSHIRHTLKDILTEKNYLVDTVKDGYELLIYLKENQAKIVILDLMMPVKDGIEVLSAIKAIAQDTKVVIYTGFSKYIHSSYVSFADKFVLKSSNPGKLLDAIEMLAN